jgi:hypothetical protein
VRQVSSIALHDSVPENSRTGVPACRRRRASFARATAKIVDYLCMVVFGLVSRLGVIRGSRVPRLSGAACVEARASSTGGTPVLLFWASIDVCWRVARQKGNAQDRVAGGARSAPDRPLAGVRPVKALALWVREDARRRSWGTCGGAARLRRSRPGQT